MARLPPQTSVLLLFLAIAAFVPVQSRSNFAEDVGNPLRKLLQGASRAGLEAGKVHLQVPAGMHLQQLCGSKIHPSCPVVGWPPGAMIPGAVWAAPGGGGSGTQPAGAAAAAAAACPPPPPRPAARHPPLRAENNDNHVFERERSSAFACRCATHSLSALGDPGCQAPLTTSGAAR
jgi:hypothetical protein